MFVADSAAQELIVFSTLSEKTLLRYRVPDTNGFSMSPRDVAVGKDGSVYVVVTDRIGTDAGAVLKYTKTFQ
jgi:DNA-binding beta-propeller fold protein YncE